MVTDSTWRCPNPDHHSSPEGDSSWTCSRCRRTACTSCEGSDDGFDHLCLACWTEIDALRSRWVDEVLRWTDVDARGAVLSAFAAELTRLAGEYEPRN